MKLMRVNHERLVGRELHLEVVKVDKARGRKVEH